VDNTPATPGTGRAGPQPQIPGSFPGRAAGEVPVFPQDPDREDEVGVLFLAGQRPTGPGEWLLITAVDGPPGADFTARVLPADGRHGHGGDVLVHLAAAPGTGDLEPPMIRVSAWTVLNGLLIPVAYWDRQNPDGWPERVRATAALAMGMLTELEDHGADLGAYHQVDLQAAALARDECRAARHEPGRPAGGEDRPSVAAGPVRRALSRRLTRGGGAAGT
jgi:hypothetical protein